MHQQLTPTATYLIFRRLQRYAGKAVSIVEISCCNRCCWTCSWKRWLLRVLADSSIHRCCCCSGCSTSCLCTWFYSQHTGGQVAELVGKLVSCLFLRVSRAITAEDVHKQKQLHGQQGDQQPAHTATRTQQCSHRLALTMCPSSLTARTTSVACSAAACRLCVRVLMLVNQAISSLNNVKPLVTT